MHDDAIILKHKSQDLNSRSPISIVKVFDALSYHLLREIAKEQYRFVLLLPIMFCLGAAVVISKIPYIAINVLFFFLIGLMLLLIGLQIVADKSNKISISWLKHFLFLLLFLIFGALVAANRIASVAAPKITHEIDGVNIAGNVISLDKSSLGNQRIVLRLDSDSNTYNLRYVRLTTSGLEFNIIGASISCVGTLFPPSKSIIPKDEAFAKVAFFRQIGAQGKCNSIKVNTSKANPIASQIQIKINSFRAKVSHNLSGDNIGGGAGFLAAVATGDRSYISPIESQNLQMAGLSHIISVSGLHVGLLGGIIFFSLSKFLSLFESLALRINVRKIAAIFAAFVISFYTIFSGAEAPAVRAMIMFYVVSIGIITNRRAISMRGLALSAFIILLFRPEDALDAGFLMSFLATLALVALWEFWQKSKLLHANNIFEKIAFWLFGSIATSAAAGLATTPISMNQFHSINTYGLIANLIAAPINDFVIAPTAIIGVIFKGTIFGDICYKIAIWGLQLILDIAAYFAKLPNSVLIIPNFDALPTSLAILGLLIFLLFVSRIRHVGVIFIVASLIAWSISPHTEALFASGGRAMMQIENKSSVKICYLRGGKYDATILLNYAAILPSAIRDIKAAIEKQWSQDCNLGGGDWEAHFVGQSDQDDPIISITLQGKNYIIDPAHSRGGAILLRDTNHLYLDTKSTPAPWD